MLFGIKYSDWALIISGLVSLGGLFLNIRKNIVENRRYTEDIINKLNNLERKLKETNLDISYIKEQSKKTSKGLKYTQRYKLYKDLTKSIVRGYTWLDEFKELTKLFDSYKYLGGNGEIEALYNVYTKLPMKEDEDGEFIEKSN